MGQGRVHHVGPPAERVPKVMAPLLAWLGNTDEHPLVASSVFHYEFEFIHPFEDGNGRLGRLWQTLILTRWKLLFAHVPVESETHACPDGYYGAIRQSSASGESTPFIAFMLNTILAALRSSRVNDQVARLITALRDGSKTTAEIMVGRRDHGGAGAVAPGDVPQQLRPPCDLRRTGGNDSSLIAVVEKIRSIGSRKRGTRCDSRLGTNGKHSRESRQCM